MPNHDSTLPTAIDADYLVVGAGGMGMAFVDTLIAETDARVVIVDHYHAPGGHWTLAYPFVRLHQPSTGYGVESRRLGNDAIDAVGWNAGLLELASVHHFAQLRRNECVDFGDARIDQFGGRGSGISRVGCMRGHQRLSSARRSERWAYMCSPGNAAAWRTQSRNRASSSTPSCAMCR